MEEQRINDNGGGFIREALYVLRRNLILMLAVVLIVTAVGIVFANVRKPNYTASVKISFQAEIVDKTNPSSQTTYDINAMRAYIDTVVDFADEGVVVDRANYYYTRYLDEKAKGIKLSEFIYSYFEQSKDENGDLMYEQKKDDKGNLMVYGNGDPIYDLTKPIMELKYNVDKFAPYNEYIPVDDVYFTSGGIGVSTTVTDNATQFVFSVRYADKNTTVAREKAEILALAFSREICSEAPNGYKYFSDLDISVKSLGYEGTSIDINKVMIIVIAFILGVFLAIAVAYIKNLLDNTVKSKEDLERLTGVKVLTAINYQGGDRHHGKK